eukprot:g19935.t1
MLVVIAGPVHAQDGDAFKSFRQLDSTGKMPKLNAFSPTATPLRGSVAKDVRFNAKLTSDGGVMEDGLAWRVFSPIAGEDGKLPLVASAEGGSADFQLAPGDYFVNVAFGRAGVTKKLTVPLEGAVDEQTLVLDAGGFLLNAVAGTDQRIPVNQLSFSVYSAEPRENGDRALVEAGKLTQAVLQHKAAQITLKLVSQAGGEAIADTAWSVLTAAGDIVNESVSAFSTMVLAEGEYLAVARNKDKIYQREFSVKAGRNTDVEVLMRNPRSTGAQAEAEPQD